jgi:hypothetical protein
MHTSVLCIFIQTYKNFPYAHYSMAGRRRRTRRGKTGRLPTPVYIEHQPQVDSFTPEPSPNGPPVILEPAELEVLRLIDLEDFTQNEAGVRMGISRGTIWRILHRARRKVVQALVEGRPIKLAQRPPP